MGQPHKHAELIRAWADGAEIEYYFVSSGKWHGCVENKPAWDATMEYRIKPDPPKYPQTRMSPAEVIAAYGTAGFNDPIEPRSLVADALVRVANTAIDRAIEDGDVVPAAMLEKVAQEVELAVTNACNYIYCGQPIDISAIIAKVKAGK